MWIVFNALLLYNIAVISGRFDAFRDWLLKALPNDRRIVLVVIGFCFGCLLEGISGFGTPVAITSALLILIGLPALEALACGAPLVTTEGTAMAEMAGAAALLVPPGDVGALGTAIGTALQEGRVTPRRSLGLTVAGERTWEASVTLHLRAYAVARAASQ